MMCQEIEGSAVVPEGFLWPPRSDPDRALYRWRDPFEAIDAGVFFGRDGATVLRTDVPRQMRQPGLKSLFVVFGPSGTGSEGIGGATHICNVRSSLTVAGINPARRNDDVPLDRTCGSRTISISQQGKSFRSTTARYSR
jgi:hypothetical protein